METIDTRSLENLAEVYRIDDSNEDVFKCEVRQLKNLIEISVMVIKSSGVIPITLSYNKDTQYYEDTIDGYKWEIRNIDVYKYLNKEEIVKVKPNKRGIKRGK